MLPYVLGLFGLWLAVLLGRWVMGRSAPILIGLVSLVLVVGGFVEVRWRMNEHAYTVAMQKLLDRKEVYVHCQRLIGTLVDASGTEGHVNYSSDGSRPKRADLTWSACHNLAKWRSGGHKATAPNDQIVAVHVLTHEAMHVSGITSEAQAECYAMQHDAEMARLLGASAARADALALRYWTQDYPRMRDDYRSGDCAPGKAMDLHPDTPDWPSG